MIKTTARAHGTPGFLKKVVEKWKESGKSEDEIKKFQQGIQSYFSKTLSPNFDDLDFYAGESMDPDGMYDTLRSFALISKTLC